MVGGRTDSGNWLARCDFATLRIRTPCVGRTLALRFCHRAATVHRTRADQLLEISKRLTACTWKRREPNVADNARIEHPLRDLEQTARGVSLQYAVEYRHSCALRDPAGPNESPATDATDIASSRHSMRWVPWCRAVQRGPSASQSRTAHTGRVRTAVPQSKAEPGASPVPCGAVRLRCVKTIDEDGKSKRPSTNHRAQKAAIPK